METGINSNREKPNVVSLLCQPTMNAAAFLEMTAKAEVVILIAYASGAMPDYLTPAVKQRIDEGVPVIVLAANFGDDHGILRAKYAAGMGSYESGAIPIQTINVAQQPELLDAINEEWANGLRDKELATAIDKRFSYTREEIEGMGHLRPIRDYYRGKYWEALGDDEL